MSSAVTIQAADEIWDGEDSWWVHACEGHYDTVSGYGEYIHEPRDRDAR
jgi:hypothetical protein